MSAATSSPGTIALPPRLEIRDVEEAHRRLVEALNVHGPLRIDVGPLVAIDSAGVQLLLAVCREGERRGLKVELCGASGALERASGLLGLAQALRPVGAA